MATLTIRLGGSNVVTYARQLFCGPRSKARRIALLTVAAWMLSLLIPATSFAHIILSNGTWTFRYFTRPHDANASLCIYLDNQDPTSIVLWQYGEYSRMDSHLSSETHFGRQSFGSDQDICSTDDGTYWWGHQLWEHQTGHGNYGTRAHFRIWFAPHPHSALVDKWSVITPHHEAWDGHNIDEDWEAWESHVGFEMWTAHNVYWDHWYRWPAGNHRGFWQNGYTTRIGGLHNGAY